jgi:hypothetical protein
LALKITGAGAAQQNLVYRVGDPVPTAAANATAAAAAILVTPANKLATGAGGIVEAKLANVDHGGNAATIMAKTVTLVNNTFAGTALSIEAGGTGGTAVAISGAF